MKSENWKKIKEVFNQASDLPKAKVASFLADYDVEIRLEVEKMLKAIETDKSLLNTPVVELNEVWQEEDLLGQKVGDYKILREIGEGGMGSVYEAIRDDGEFEQRVAIKLIKSGLGSKEISSRFRHERQILASLEHPNIARLLGGGMTQKGLPYYAMEFIEGKPIDEFCTENNLSINERLELFRQVCAAVSFAHSRLVVHRDLKPSNIFVTKDGIVKLLDFGISKVLTPNSDQMGTATQLGIMTPAYASPEQVRGETVTTSTDVYSLGVILYELLTDQLPYQTKGKSIAELLQIVSEAQIPKPSENPKSKIKNLKLKGDIDTITLKALNREIERRYASVEQLSEDIRRYLNDLPIKAQADTFSYRYRKFIQRNKVGVIATSAVFLALIGGILATLYQNRIARQQQAIAEKRFEQVRKLANNVVFKYHDAIANLAGATETREMLVKDAVEYLDNLAEDAGDNPELQLELANAYLKIGKVQGDTYVANLGKTDNALENYEKGQTIIENVLDKNSQNVVYLATYSEILEAKTANLARQNKFKLAETTAEKLIETNQKIVALQSADKDSQIILARSYLIYADALAFSGGYEKMTEWYRKSLEIYEKLKENFPNDEKIRRSEIVPMQRIGTKSEYQAEILKEKNAPKEEINAIYLEAEKLHRRSFEIAESLKKDFPNNEIYARYFTAVQINLGTALARIGKGNEGIPLIKKSCDQFRQTIDSDSKNNEAKRDLAECLQYLAFGFDAMNNSNEAINANEDSLKILEEITVKDPTNFEFLSQTHLTYNNTGDIFLRQGKFAEALNFYQKGIEYVEKISKLNQTQQIELLRADSNRKIGNAHLALAEKTKNAENFRLTNEFLTKAKTDLVALQEKNELGKTNEYLLELVENSLKKVESLKVEK
jgi:tRNA A-37 threonylcarbamoyl transferase component Bud32/tetratricopeptide (TPR) repeat protein